MTTTNDRVALGKRLLQAATEQSVYILLLAPYGCFGDWSTVTRNGKPCVTTKPREYWGGRMPVIFVDTALVKAGNYYDYDKNVK